MRKATGTRSRGPVRKKSVRKKSARKKAARRTPMSAKPGPRASRMRAIADPALVTDLCVELLGAVHSQSRGFAPEEIAPEKTRAIDTYTDPAHVRAMQRLVARAEQVFGEGTADAAAASFTEEAR